MIVIDDRLISDEDCSYLINFYNNNSKDCWKHEEQYPISIYKDGFIYEDEILNNTLKKIQSFAQKIIKDIEIDWATIVKWPTESWQAMHIDDARSDTTFTSILYLNSNFRGGETRLMDGTFVAPVPGRIFCFDGAKYKHAVNHISNGERYTIAIWYKNKEKSN